LRDSTFSFKVKETKMKLVAKDGKIVEFGVLGTKFWVAVDPNDDGEALISIEIDLAEVPDELLAIFSKK